MKLLPFPYCLREGAGGRVEEAMGRCVLRVVFPPRGKGWFYSFPPEGWKGGYSGMEIRFHLSVEDCIDYKYYYFWLTDFNNKQH
jgi:hypothetical protein